jgi:O-antigen/teichoic acid export membrane protein
MMKSVSSNWGVTLATIAAAYLLTPFTIHRLGDGGYGTWNLINAITGYLALLVLGVPMASVRYFAEHVADGNIEKLNEAIGSCTALYLALGGMALLVGVGMYFFYDFTYTIPTTVHADANWSGSSACCRTACSPPTMSSRPATPSAWPACCCASPSLSWCWSGGPHSPRSR